MNTLSSNAMVNALVAAREKLVLYRQAHSGEYIGGTEFTALIFQIDSAIGNRDRSHETCEPRGPSGHVGGCMCSPCREWRLVQYANAQKASRPKHFGALDGVCDDCPPIGYPTNKTRCAECPRLATAQKAEEGRS